MKAKKKPMEKKKVSDFEFDAKNRLKTLKVTGTLHSCSDAICKIRTSWW